MKKDRSPFRGLLGRAQKSFARSRPGSVLILVVALLVLMALIGTAYMSMAQQDRVISAQHTNNNEIDLLMDGLANILRSSVATELFNQGKYRPGAGYNVPNSNGYNHYTGLGLDRGHVHAAATNTGSPFLAARAPELFGEITPTGPLGTASTSNAPMWSFITAPLIGGQFSSPLAPSNPNVPFLYGQLANSYTYLQRSSRMGVAAPVPLYPGVYKGLPAWVNNPDPALGDQRGCRRRCRRRRDCRLRVDQAANRVNQRADLLRRIPHRRQRQRRQCQHGLAAQSAGNNRGRRNPRRVARRVLPDLDRSGRVCRRL